MTREEFESILEEAYIEGYNTAIEDIQEDILDEEAYDLEGEYDYYTEEQDGHPRTLRGTGIHNLPKGALGALRNSQKLYKKDDALYNKYVDSVRGNNINERMSAKKKSNNARRKAKTAFEKYIKNRYESPEEYKQIDRRVDGPSYKNPIKRIIDRKLLHAGDDKIMGKKNFLNEKIK